MLGSRNSEDRPNDSSELQIEPAFDAEWCRILRGCKWGKGESDKLGHMVISCFDFGGLHYLTTRRAELQPQVQGPPLAHRQFPLQLEARLQVLALTHRVPYHQNRRATCCEHLRQA